MSTPADGDGQEHSAPTGTTRRPGHQLGAARERAGLSTEEMATRLNLSRDHLEALERDDYTHLPAAAFVRGYLRAYAREVGLDGDELVAEFDAVCGHPDAPELVISSGAEDPARASGPMVAALILVAVVVIGALAWWFQQGTELPPAGDTGMTESSQEAEVTSADVETDEGASSATEYGSEPTPEPAEGESTTADDTASPEVAESEESMADSDTEVGSEDPAAADDSAATETAADPDVQADDPEALAAVDETEPVAAGEQDAEVDTEQSQSDGPLATSDASLAASEAAATGPDRLEIRVDGESWLEVYDSRGRRLVYTLYSGTSPVVVNGWAPFDIFLGNAPAVTVEYADQVIDPSAFVRSDNTARFRADAEGVRSR